MKYASVVHAFVLVSAAFALAATMSAWGKDSPAAEAAPADLIALAKRVASKQPLIRSTAHRRIYESRNRAISELILILIAHSKEKDDAEDSVACLAIGSLATLRATEARKALLDRIDYQVRLKGGGKRPLGAEFPCALALIRIGGDPNILTALSARIATDKSEKRRALYTWVMHGLLGPEMTRVCLQNAARKQSGGKKALLLKASRDAALGNALLLRVRRK